jgi:hypothetical protein
VLRWMDGTRADRQVIDGEEDLDADRPR